MRRIAWVAIVLAASVVAAGALAWGTPVVRWEFADPAGWESWGLWQFVENRQLGGEPPAVRNFPSPTWAAYFGIVNPVSNTGSYHTGQREQGGLFSPWLPVGAGAGLQPGDLIRVRFSHYRQVESYSGPYDKTIVHLLFQNAAGRHWNPTTKAWQATPVGVEVFYRDSSHPSVTTWQTFQSENVEVPQGAVRVQVVFRFDSVDHVENHYLGWLVDNVEIHRTGAPLAIVTQNLNNARVDQWYDDVLEGKGGTPPYTWAVAAGSTLPAGLVLNRTTGEITGKPTEAGSFEVEFVLADAARGEAKKPLTLVVWQPWGVGGWLLHHDFSAGFDDWAREGLWRHAEVSELRSSGAYYAVPGANHYATGRRTRGFLRSPEIDVSAHQGKDLEIGFGHTRGVETYAGGGYDKTYVQIRFASRGTWSAWTTAWYRDSKDLSTWPRTQWERAFAQVPADAQKLELQFYFDSVDAVENAFPGWFVSWVGIVAFTGPLAISTTELPPGELGVPYSATVRATGGDSGSYRWSASGLPDALAIERDTGRIHGTPRKAGVFTVRITVEDAFRNPVSKEFTLEIKSEQVTLFHEDFEGFVAGAKWLPLPGHPSLWQVVDQVGFGGENLIQGRAAYYGRGHESSYEYSYDTGDKTSGAFISKPIALSDTKYVKVSFDYWREVESYSGEYDQSYVEVRFGGGPWQTLWYMDARNPSERKWTTYASPGITVPAGATTIQIRFVFDSVDRHNNRFVGWIVDNVRVRRTTTGSPLSTLAVPTAEPRGTSTISVFNYPNPVRDVHTTTFAVRGVEAEAIRVEIFDLAGRLVYRAEVAGTELVWHTDDLFGRYLANGVYLYRVHVRVGGAWIASEIQKLAILR